MYGKTVIKDGHPFNESTPELSFIDQIELTKTDPGSSRHLYVIRTKYRDKLCKFLKKKSIHVQLHYPYSLNKVNALKSRIRKIKLVPEQSADLK